MIDFYEFRDENVKRLAKVCDSVDRMRELVCDEDRHLRRCLSLAITKAEEAAMWLEETSNHLPLGERGNTR